MFALKDMIRDDNTDGMNEILRKHEVSINRQMSILLVALTVLSFVLLLSLRFSVISYDYSSTHIPYYCVNILLMVITVIFITATKGEHRLGKYLILFSITAIAFNFNTHYVSFGIMYLLPLLVAAAYRSKETTVVITVLIVIVSFISVYLSVLCGNFSYDYMTIKGLSDGTVMVDMTIDEITASMLQNYYLPFLVVFIILAAVTYLTTVKGLKLMREKAAADDSRMRMDRELGIASEIQKGMLPADSFENGCCSINASMRPAKVVGGDYYDYFMPDERHMVLLIADVSGKGVPASLFMASAKTMMHSYAMEGSSPADVFDSVNHSLCDSNPEKLFITAWMGKIDLETGRLTYANAGHNPPYIIKSDGTVEMMKSPPNFILGRKKSIRYKDRHLDIGAGDKLFLYTDGLTEAMDTDGKMYSADRLESVLREHPSSDTRDLIGKVNDSIASFVGDAEQSDDSTMISMRYDSPFIPNDDPGRTFILNKGTFPEILSYINNALKEKGCTDKTATDVEICSSEILSNIDMYAYSGAGNGEVTVSVNMDDRRVKLIFIDSGPEYDPLKHTNPDTEKRISEHKIGGFGILIVKKMMDDVTYERKDGKNILTIKKEL